MLQGASQKNCIASVDKLWAINKKVIDPKSPRFSIVSENYINLKIKNFEKIFDEVPKFKKNLELGFKKVFYEDIIISREDLVYLKENQIFTLTGIGNCKILRIADDELNVEKIEDTDFKNTVKISWISKKNAKFIKIIEFKELSHGTEIEDFNHDSKYEFYCLVEAGSNCKIGSVVQFERYGFCYCDSEGVFHLIPYTKQKRSN